MFSFSLAVSRNALPLLVSFTILMTLIHFSQWSFPGVTGVSVQEAARLPELEHAKAQSIVVYCGKGTARGPEAVHILSQAGFTRVVNLGPGIEGWRAARLPVTAS